MTQEITKDQLIKLAQDMVVASQLQAFYGIGPMVTAKAAFEEGLQAFEKKTSTDQETPRAPSGTFIIGEQCPPIPDFLKFN